ncbi:bifunctional glycosyltransferase/CDP-glycerol:glycerophosphate glycerophosphotransferase [Neobacillus mesonae]|nr:bifunctional glycosyltransferase family 2 protein/CDP-glycerol:glycerophosphate glycerophosphotransferase [Neobacillus mesonae]
MSTNFNYGQKRPKLSVVVIAFNNELYIEEALESLNEQTFDDLEVIVVDDFSNDRTGEIIDRYIEGKPKFKAIHLQENSGGCSTPRNTGIANSTGEYLMFLDGDDWYTIDACEKMVAAIERTKSDFVAGQAIRTNNYQIWYHKRIYSMERVNINVREFPILLHDSLSVNKIYQRSFLEKHNLRFPEGIHYEDVVFTGKAYFLADSISVIPEPIYFWRVVENAEVKSISNRRFEFSNFKNRIIAHRLYDKFIKENGDILYQGFKNRRFLIHDLRLYVNDYLLFDEEYKAKFHALIYEYLHEVMDEYTFLNLAENERILFYLLYIGDKDAFQDFVAYINGEATSIDRIYSKENNYYFKTIIPGKSHEKFLRISKLKVNFSIYDLKMGDETLSFRYNANVQSVNSNDITYSWVLINKKTKSIIDTKVLTDNLVTFSLKDITPGKSYLYLYVNHLGNTHKWIVKKTNIKYMANLMVNNGKYSKVFFINKNNSFAVKVLFLNELDRIKWRLNKRGKKGFIRKKVEFYAKKIFRRLPLKSNWVLFESHMGKQYSDSPKYIYEEMLRTHKNYKFIWSFENPDSIEVPGSSLKVKRNSLSHYYYLVRSKYWVDNQGMARLAPKKKQQIYLQTWHGTPLKRMGYDQKRLPSKKELEKLKFQTSKWNFFISPNPYSTTIFKRAFRIGSEIIESGYPRNDILINQPEDIIRTTKEHFGIDKTKRIILFAPTFRDWDPNSFQKTVRDIQLLSKEIGDNSILMLRLHYLLSSKISQRDLPSNVINASGYQDIQELYLISDVLITDYSSVMFDFALLRRPIILYCYDLEEYTTKRGMYFDLAKEGPGPVCRTIEDVVTMLKDSKKLQEFDEPLERFTSKFGSLEDGKSSLRVIKEVFK